MNKLNRLAQYGRETNWEEGSIRNGRDGVHACGSSDVVLYRKERMETNGPYVLRRETLPPLHMEKESASSSHSPLVMEKESLSSVYIW